MAHLLLLLAAVKSAKPAVWLVIVILFLGGTSAHARKPKPPKMAAAFVSQSIPSDMVAGQSYLVTVTMQNTGSKSWNSGKFHLTSQNPSNNATWGLSKVSLSGPSVDSGSNAIFNFSVSAPNTPGNYNFQWRMQQGSNWFGSASENVLVAVSSSTPTPTPSPTPTATPTPTPSPTPSATPPPGNSTAYVAHLRAQSAGSLGSGTAILRLAEDEASAVISFSYSNFSSPVTGVHIHGPASPGQSGGILFDVDAAPAQADGTYQWIFVPVGINTVADIVAAIKAGRTYFNVHTSNNPTGEIIGFFNLAGGNQSVPVPTPPPALPGGTPTAEDASRFLNQATFGVTEPLIASVQQQGFDAFLSAQFTTAATSNLAFFDGHGPNAGEQEVMDGWWTTAVTAPDQVRQRVAFALSEILVVSFENSGLDEHPESVSAYYDILINNAFGNYRQLLQDVTLSPTMGVYLDMLRSDIADPESGSHPNENYPRELMQLFSIGLYKLNLDGSLTLGSDGLPIPTYDQAAVTGLAGVTTGWTFSGSTDFWDGAANFRQAMANFAEHHTPEAKSILNGVTIPAGQTAQQDLQTALDAIFNHPNLGKFIGRQLIQRLVTSNPSPGYVYRVATAFDDNGHGVRGDMKAVIRAILLDYDARGPARSGQGVGKEKEPVIRLTNLFRIENGNPENGIYSFWLAPEFGQEPLHSPTVFNFFTPDYVAPGAIALAGLRSPEFQIMTETTVVEQANTIYAALYWGNMDFTPELPLASDPAALVDHYNRLLMNGAMSSAMRTSLINTIGQLPSDDPWERVQSVLWLILNSPEYVIEK